MAVAMATATGDSKGECIGQNSSKGGSEGDSRGGSDGDSDEWTKFAGCLESDSSQNTSEKASSLAHSISSHTILSCS